MTRQRKLSGTVGGRMGIYLFDGPRPYFWRARHATEGPQGEPQAEPSRTPPPPGMKPSEPPVAVDDSWLMPDSQPPRRRVPEPTMMLDAAELEYLDNQPPPRERAPLPQPPPKLAPLVPVAPPALSMPQGWPENVTQRPSAESMAFSLEALIAAQSGQPAPEPARNPPKRAPQESVVASLEEIRAMERDRVEAERRAAIQAEQAEADAKEPHISLDVLTGKKKP